jgi:hypothetical protein
MPSVMPVDTEASASQLDIGLDASSFSFTHHS